MVPTGHGDTDVWTVFAVWSEAECREVPTEVCEWASKWTKLPLCISLFFFTCSRPSGPLSSLCSLTDTVFAEGFVSVTRLKSCDVVCQKS